MTFIFRLPQDIFQTAKISKILMAINKGKGAQYKGKGLDEIELSDNLDSDNSDDEIDLKKNSYFKNKSLSAVKEDSNSFGESSKTMGNNKGNYHIKHP